MKLGLLFSSILAVAGLASAASIGPDQLLAEISSLLPGRSFLSSDPPPRWSVFGAPEPRLVVNVRNEREVAIAVKYCASKNIPFLAQNGGNGWATTFDLGENGILINLAGLDQVTFNHDKTEATIGGGSNINNTISKAFAAGAIVTTGNCNCVGALGAMLGGGYGNLMGLNGFGVDNIISMRVVTADGRIKTVTESSDPDLFWGLRGAGPNLGIVTSAVVRSTPASQEDMQAWAGALIFTPDKLEQLVQAIQDIELRPEMNVFMYFITSGPPNDDPAILITPFLYKGNVEAGREAFASFYNIGPAVDNTAVIPYNQWNTGGDTFCVPGARKPSYSAGFQTMVPSVWQEIWDLYTEFQALDGAEASVVLLEAYSLEKARSVDLDSAAFPFRNVNFNAVVIPWYEDAALDEQAQTFGSKVRDLWRGADELSTHSTYINFAHGDEPLSEVYGESLSRLQTIKQQADPKNRFNQWFPIQ